MSLLDQARAADAEAEVDMNVEGAGFVRELAPAGPTLARLVGYVELGSHVDTYEGKPKAPCRKFRLSFALLGPKHIDADGKPRIMHSKSLNIMTDAKAIAFKTFAKMNYLKKAKSFSGLLNEVYLISVVHVPDKKDPNTIYDNLDLSSIAAPIDPLSGATYSAPEVPEEMFNWFLFDKPNPEQWKKLFIEGTREDGTSKNWLQDLIMRAVDFPGSALEQMLVGGVPTPQELAAPAAAPVTPAAIPAAPAPASAPVLPAAPAAPVAPVV